MRSQPREVLVGVCGEVEVELRDRGLHDAPHRLPEVRHEPHQLEDAPVARAQRPDVGLEQRVAGFLVEPVVDAEVREVEEDVTHPGVLPVDDPQSVAVVDEVRIEEIVVARTLRRGPAEMLDPTCELAGR